MRITFLGHAGFCVETDGAVIVTDPWLSPTGAFEAAWFQFPRNHHLAGFVEERLGQPGKERFLYISHEHKDHLDLAFLERLRCRDFTLVVADFDRDALRRLFAGYGCKAVVALRDRQEVAIPGGSLVLYVDDSELNRDSAILIRADGQRFLNLNDCRIFDALPRIRREEGVVDVFACQFSGAGWHPTCYDYPRDLYEAIAGKKVRTKFRGVAQALRVLEPRVYLPSAGPPCFLDPALVHLNFEPVNIFPKAPELIRYLDRTLPNGTTTWFELMPGDVVDARSGSVVHKADGRVSEREYDAYIRAYAADYAEFFELRARAYAGVCGQELLERLRDELLSKLEAFPLRRRLSVPLYFRLPDTPRVLRIDFPGAAIELIDEIEDRDHYSITAPASEIARVLDGTMTWDDFALSFRMRLNRQPDVHQTAVQGFLRLGVDDLERFCTKLLRVEENRERVTVEADGKRYEVNRYCPHQGGDLSRGWIEDDRFLTCPRHQWQFDLEDGGSARGNDGTIEAICVDPD